MSHCDVLSGEERDEGVCLSVCRVDVAKEFEVHARVSGSLVSGSEMRIVVVPGEVDLGRVSVQGEFQPVTGSLFTLGLSLFDQTRRRSGRSTSKRPSRQAHKGRTPLPLLCGAKGR